PGCAGNDNVFPVFQFTAARRRLRNPGLAALRVDAVSIHSRPKAAALCAKIREESVKYNYPFANLFRQQRVWQV
ncbi:hypothetical protein, partial [Cardiobacterium valvarum]